MYLSATAMIPEVRRRPETVSSVPVALFGLLLITLAVFRAPWPFDPPSLYGTTGSYFDRLQGKKADLVAAEVMQEYRSTEWYGRRVFDALALGLLVLGYGLLALAIWFDERRALFALTLVGIVGLVYGGGVGLDVGPILTTSGFSLILFGTGLQWVSINRRHVSRQKRETYDTHFTA